MDDDDEDDDDYDDEDDDEENDIESAMNAFLVASRGLRPAGEDSSLSSKRFFTGSYGSSASTTSESLSGLISSSVYPKLELLINDNVLPSSMTIYQAIKQYASIAVPAPGETAFTENDMDNTPLLNNAIWSKVHTIHYRLASPTLTTPIADASSSEASTSKEADSKRSSRNSKQQSFGSSTAKSASSLNLNPKKVTNKNDSTESLEANTTLLESIKSPQKISNINSDLSLTTFFTRLTNVKNKLEQNISDKSIESIALLRLLSILNREWSLMYHEMLSCGSLLTPSNSDNLPPSSFLVGMNEFVNAKLTAKANRQLQDPLVIMTGTF